MEKLLSSFAVLVALGSSTGAASPGQSTAAPTAAPAQDAQPTDAVELPSDYVVGPEDVLGIVFWREPDVSGDVTVRPDGRITIPVLGEMQAAGLRPENLQATIVAAASKYFTDPNVTVVVRTINSRKVFVTGQVATPGAHQLTGPLTVMQAIALAGGVTEFADAKNVTILRTDGGRTRSFKFNYRDVAKGKNLVQNILLRPGDTVVVP
jgi:polysaccharide biosynthesis/export protein